MTTLAWAKGPSFSPSLEDFQAACIQHRLGADAVEIDSSIPLNKVTFQPVKALERLQTTFSFERVERVITEIDKEERGRISSGTFQHNGGNSFYPKERMITTIRYKGKLYILDGHHRALVSTYLGARTIPVKIIADWSFKSEAKFFSDLKAQEFSYFMNLEGEWVGPGEFCDMISDPLLFLTRKLLLRVDLTYDAESGDLQILNERGSKLPIGIKLNRDVPFTEQEIARRLRAGGVLWKKGDEIDIKLLKKFLKILEEDRDSSRLAQLLLLDKPTPVAELDLEEAIRKHFQRVQCEFQMSGGDLD
jgi:hypothetical protein